MKFGRVQSGEIRFDDNSRYECEIRRLPKSLILTLKGPGQRYFISAVLVMSAASASVWDGTGYGVSWGQRGNVKCTIRQSGDELNGDWQEESFGCGVFVGILDD